MKWIYGPPPHRKQVLLCYVPTSKSAKGKSRYTVGWHDGERWIAESKTFNEANLIGWLPIVDAVRKDA